MNVLGRLVLSLLAAVAGLVLAYPVACVGGEFQPVDRCENLLGLWLPGFSYRAPGEEWKVYVVPLAVTVFASLVAWRLTRGRATWRS